MSYFNNPRTEEELKNQYRQLLIKNDYRNPKNEAIINAIRKEYEEHSMQIKRANGYRTPVEKIGDYISKEATERNNARIAEQNRVKGLQKHKYTKEEYTKALNSVKYYLRQTIEIIVKNKTFTSAIITKLNRLDDIGFYQWFNAQCFTWTGDIELDNKYNSSREVLEYAIKSISEQTHTNQEKNMLTMEKSLGQYFRDYFNACCDKYLDPIDIAKHEMDSRKEAKTQSKLIVFTCYGITWMITFALFAVFTGMNVTATTNVELLMGVNVVLATIISIPLGKFFSKKFLKFDKRTTYSTYGTGYQKARVSETKTYETTKTNTNIIRLFFRTILRMFGIR